MTDQQTNPAEPKVLYRAEMPPGFESGPAPTMSHTVYWLLSLLLMDTPRNVQDQPSWQAQVNHLIEHTADGLDADRWDIADDWLARAFKDISAGLPEHLAQPLRRAAAQRSIDTIEAVRLIVQDSDEYATEARKGVGATGDGSGPLNRLMPALACWVSFAVEYRRPLEGRSAGVFRQVAAVATLVAPLRQKTELTYGVQDLMDSLGWPKRNLKRMDGPRSAKNPQHPGSRYPY
ncbi:hypothetical protein [Curtobacterium sp. MCBD17_008]|uniref:hypothetical protein n=1 Tax=Curtobacterium sp. MCBD17_008 TaxID=2175656 RepID=UPI000DA9011A|nr:hypothetical protein [Curtobacterium sp. MCBD17_008]PZE92902.1 hypothetical protein DEI95_08055 [Curtobacterium sp. MCBD17_008]